LLAKLPPSCPCAAAAAVRSARASHLERPGSTPQIPDGVSVCDWMGTAADLDSPE
jgi:hypothetical protein